MCKNAQDKNREAQKKKLDALKQKFDQVFNEPVPPRLAALVDKIKAQEVRKKNEG